MEGMPLKGILSLSSLPALFEVSNLYAPIMTHFVPMPHTNVAKWPWITTSEIMLQKQCSPLSNWFISGIRHSEGKLTQGVCSRLRQSILSIYGIRGFVHVRLPAFSAPSLSAHTASRVPFRNTLRFFSKCLLVQWRKKKKQNNSFHL